MKIELQAPIGRVSESILNLLKRKLIDFHIRHREIGSAHVYFREPGKTQKSCSIQLKVKGVAFFVHQTAATFEKACALVVAEIESRLKMIFRKAELLA